MLEVAKATFGIAAAGTAFCVVYYGYIKKIKINEQKHMPWIVPVMTVSGIIGCIRWGLLCVY